MGQEAQDLRRPRQDAFMIVAQELSDAEREVVRPSDKKKLETWYRLKEIYTIHAGVRDRARNFFEEVEGMAFIFRQRYLPPVTPQDVAAEDTEFYVRMVERLHRVLEGFSEEDEADYLQINHPLKRTHEKIQQQQFARYIADKMAYLMQQNNFAGARKLFEKSKQKLEKNGNMEGVQELEDAATLVAIDGVLICLKNHNYTGFFDALRELSSFAKFHPSDFTEALRDFLQSATFQMALKERLGRFAMSADPNAYPALRDCLVELGFLNK